MDAGHTGGYEKALCEAFAFVLQVQRINQEKKDFLFKLNCFKRFSLQRKDSFAKFLLN